MLHDALEEKGLAICCGTHKECQGVKNPTDAQLGIYPRNQMRLHYYKSTLGKMEDEYGTTFHRTIRVALYCPKHFPQDPNRIILPNSDDPPVYSEIKQEGKQFILEVNRKDIAALIKKGGMEIDPNGKRYPEVEIYRHFGIPDLPEKPDINEVKYRR